MKKYILLILFICLFSCKQSTESKIKSALEKIERNGNSNLEYLKIDSISYSRGSLMNYYILFANKENQFAKETKDLRTSIFDNLNSSYVLDLPDETLLSSASLIVRLSHEIMIAEDKYKFYSDLAEKPDTSTEVYTVNYNLSYKTSDYTHNGNETAFLYANTLAPVEIDVDSIFENSNSKQIVYDSSEEKEAIIQTYKLQKQAIILQNELDLKIAGGFNVNVILDYRVRIAKLREQAAYNKVKYYWLYT